MIPIISLKNKEAGTELDTVAMTECARGSDGDIVDEAAIGTTEVGYPI